MEGSAARAAALASPLTHSLARRPAHGRLTRFQSSPAPPRGRPASGRWRRPPPPPPAAAALPRSASRPRRRALLETAAVARVAALAQRFRTCRRAPPLQRAGGLGPGGPAAPLSCPPIPAGEAGGAAAAAQAAGRAPRPLSSCTGCGHDERAAALHAPRRQVAPPSPPGVKWGARPAPGRREGRGGGAAAPGRARPCADRGGRGGGRGLRRRPRGGGPGHRCPCALPCCCCCSCPARAALAEPLPDPGGAPRRAQGRACRSSWAPADGRGARAPPRTGRVALLPLLRCRRRRRTSCSRLTWARFLR
jgi:hypothetical protein